MYDRLKLRCYIGESVPQLKESLGCFDDQSIHIDLGDESNIDDCWRRYMIFGGTVMLQNEEGLMEAGRKLPNPQINPGCLAVVVRTGFGTCQGGM